MKDFKRIPTLDLIGNKVRINDQAVLLSPRGIHYEGTVQQIGGKRWFVVDKNMKIGGIGNMHFLKTT